MNTRRHFLKSLVSMVAAVPIVNTLIKSPPDVWSGISIPANKAKKFTFADALNNGVIKIYSGEAPSTPYESINGKEVARIRYSKGLLEAIKNDRQ